MLESGLHDCKWLALLANQFAMPYMKTLDSFLIRQTEPIYPATDAIFLAFNETPFDQVKVVIVGQDPYPTPGHAHGLAFSVEPHVTHLPKSLKNIFTELNDDLAIRNTSGCLLPWARQGVFLLNSVLTVEQGKPGSHAQLGWEKFTDAVIELINTEKENVVFVLWGNYAQTKGKFINREKHHVIASAHPSPLSAYRGFFGSKPFSQINTYLIDSQLEPINWQL
jgi:uracil-DNA glycosylase